MFEQSSDQNMTVFCGGLENPNDQEIRSAFSCYGEITDISCHDSHAFISFKEKESACTALCSVNGTMISGKKGTYITLDMMYYYKVLLIE